MSDTGAVSQIRALAEEILLDTVFSLEQPVGCEGLSFVPIVQVEESTTEVEYITTAQALKAGVLEIIEGGDAVNTIIARNKGEIPILIEEAEVLVAQGSQDRMVVASVILQPGQETRIPVKCVHAPHSLHRGAGYGTMGYASYGLKSDIRRQKYQSIMTDVDHYTPETAVDQGAVWAKVEEYCGEAGTRDPTKYTEALKELRKIAEKSASEVKDTLPEKTCGLIVVRSDGKIIAMELYRSKQAFWNRIGFLESILLEYGKKEQSVLEGEAAWSAAIQLLLKLKDINPDEVIQKQGSDNLHIGLEELRGEAITGELLKSELKSLKSILYCSLGI
ncbi:MAG: DUF6569 family protein [Candidatus Thorarchaeota archaeon]